MRTNPVSDVLDFLTQGGWTSYAFWLLTLASIVIAAVNLLRDPTQRSTTGTQFGRGCLSCCDMRRSLLTVVYGAA